jgi:excisionase family DNA binding protein
MPTVMTGGVSELKPDVASPLLVSVKEAARLLAVSRPTVWRLIAAGKLETVPIVQRRRLIRYSSLERLIDRD